MAPQKMKGRSPIEDLRKELERLKKETAEKDAVIKKTSDDLTVLSKEFKKSHEELRKLDQLKNDFISTVSHELRTPLSITKEGLSLVLDRIPGEINDKQRHILATAKGNIDRLARLINDLLDISKIESGKVELKRSLVNLTSLIKHVAYSFEYKIKAKGLELRALFPENGIEIYADGDKIIQVITNLVGNALKFTDKGQVKITAGETAREVECSVEDTGMGIAQEDVSRVFDKFQQFSRTAGPGEKGTGLGLAISKRLVELHHGTIRVQSQLGRGTKFIFTLPKYDPETLFKEYLHNGMREVMKTGTKLSLIVVSVRDFEQLRQKLPAQKLDHVLKSLELFIKNNLRHSGNVDVSLRETGELVVILVNCQKEHALKVQGRIKEAFTEYLKKERLEEEIHLNFGCSTYPDEGVSDEELIKKARGEKS